MANDKPGTGPKRIQRKRTKGWKMPPNTVYVGRPSKWAPNQRITRIQTLDRILREYRKWANAVEIRSELRGKDLCCTCPLNQPCIADILLEIAND